MRTKYVRFEWPRRNCSSSIDPAAPGSARSRKPRSRSGSNRSSSRTSSGTSIGSGACGCVIASSRGDQRGEVAAEDAFQIAVAEPAPLDLPEDGAVIVATVGRGISVGPVAAVQAARRSEGAQRLVPQRFVQVGAGQIDED